MECNLPGGKDISLYPRINETLIKQKTSKYSGGKDHSCAELWNPNRGVKRNIFKKGNMNKNHKQGYTTYIQIWGPLRPILIGSHRGNHSIIRKRWQHIKLQIYYVQLAIFKYIIKLSGKFLPTLHYVLMILRKWKYWGRGIHCGGNGEEKGRLGKMLLSSGCANTHLYKRGRDGRGTTDHWTMLSYELV